MNAKQNFYYPLHYRYVKYVPSYLLPLLYNFIYSQKIIKIIILYSICTLVSEMNSFIFIAFPKPRNIAVLEISIYNIFGLMKSKCCVMSSFENSNFIIYLWSKSIRLAIRFLIRVWEFKEKKLVCYVREIRNLVDRFVLRNRVVCFYKQSCLL